MGSAQSYLQDNQWLPIGAALALTYVSAKYLLGPRHPGRGARRARRPHRVRAPRLTPHSNRSAWRDAFVPERTSLEATLKLAVQNLSNNDAVFFMCSVEPAAEATDGHGEAPSGGGASSVFSNNTDTQPNQAAGVTDSAESESESGTSTTSSQVLDIDPTSVLLNRVWQTEQFSSFVGRGAEMGVPVVAARVSSKSDDGRFILHLLQQSRQANAAPPGNAQLPITAPVVLVGFGEILSVVALENQVPGVIMHQLEQLKSQCDTVATQTGPADFRTKMEQRMRALADMRAHYGLRLLVQRGVINPGDVIIDDPNNPAHNTDNHHGSWADIRGTTSAGGAPQHGPGHFPPSGGGGGLDPVEEVQRFLLKEEQERALQESLKQDQAKAAAKAETERLRLEKEKAEQEAAEAAEAAEVWARMHREHLLESFNQETNAESEILRLSLVYPLTGRRLACKLPATTTLGRLAEYAYAHSQDDEGLDHDHLENGRIAFHTAVPKPRLIEVQSDDLRRKSLQDAGLRTGTLLRVRLL